MMTNVQLVDKLKPGVEVVEEIGVSIGADPNLIVDELATYLKEIGVDATNARTIHTTEAKKRAQESYLVIILLSAVDCNRTGGRLLQELKNDAIKGQFTLPGTLEEALVMINKYSATSSTLRATGSYEQVAFAQKEEAAENTHTKKKLLEYPWPSKAEKLSTRAESPVIGAKRRVNSNISASPLLLSRDMKWRCVLIWKPNPKKTSQISILSTWWKRTQMHP